MKIVTGPCTPSVTLMSIGAGLCLRFVNNLHQKHQVEDVFVRLNACSTYVPEKIKREGCQVPVVNLRTGELAYVTQRREVFPVTAELCVSE